MKINSNCARRVLIECEKIPYNKGLYVNELCNKLMEYSNDDILNHQEKEKNDLYNLEIHGMIMTCRKNVKSFLKGFC